MTVEVTDLTIEWSCDQCGKSQIAELDCVSTPGRVIASIAGLLDDFIKAHRACQRPDLRLVKNE